MMPVTVFCFKIFSNMNFSNIEYGNKTTFKYRKFLVKIVMNHYY